MASLPARLRQTALDLEVTARALWQVRRGRKQPATPTHVFFCLVDHFEPQVGRPDRRISQARVQHWLQEYPRIAARHRDADGRHPRHTFFYPWDECDAWELAHLAELCHEGWGELELHLHHHGDDEVSLRRKLRAAIATYSEVGCLSVDSTGRTRFGFIHGNWALDNSRHENGRDFCGVNNEITILREEGCYADFTFPAWKQASQPRQVNSIYYARDDPNLPKSHDTGCPARVGEAIDDELLIIQGPLVPYFDRGRLRMDDADLAHYRPYHPARADRWVSANIHVQGRPDWVFVKAHTHGAADANREMLLCDGLDRLFSDLETRYNDGRRYCLHYVTAREMASTIYKAAKTTTSPNLDARTPIATLTS